MSKEAMTTSSLKNQKETLLFYRWNQCLNPGLKRLYVTHEYNQISITLAYHGNH